MAGVEAPRVGNTISSCSRHEEAHTLIINKTFCPEGRDGCFVVIKKTIDFFIGRFAGLTAREMKEV